MKQLLIILTLGMLVSCVQSVEKAFRIHSYFDLDSLLDTQLIGRDDPPLVFDKKVFLDGETAQKTISFDSAAWAKELKILRDFDINKTEYVGAYEVHQSDDKVNYQLKSDEKSPVKNLVVSFKEGKVSQIDGLFLEDRSIYQHQRKMKILFDRGSIEVYEFRGFQKMIMKDTISYEVISKALDQ